ncbi:sulfite exporter TauE/SafE family protein [Mycolicibacterium moriokaense]|nr:sulfite exporter TauE/SafE family protein [Mycolicibacterium moriokaense]
MGATVWSLPPLAWVVVVAVVVVGGVVRGFGGFGASMVWVTGLSLVLPPSSAIPTAFVLEVLASVQMLPGVWRQVHWRSLRWLLAGAVLGTPVGTWLLGVVPVEPMRILLACAVLAAAIAMASKFRAAQLPGPAATTAVGGVSGVLNGAFAMGGPPAILLYFSSPAAVAAGRASLIVYFLGTDLWATASAAAGGLITAPLVGQIAVLFPVSLVGVGIGALLFKRTPSTDSQRYALWLLAILSAAVLVQAVWQ